jgi:hypothetical protein
MRSMVALVFDLLGKLPHLVRAIPPVFGFLTSSHEGLRQRKPAASVDVLIVRAFTWILRRRLLYPVRLFSELDIGVCELTQLSAFGRVGRPFRAFEGLECS